MLEQGLLEHVLEQTLLSCESALRETKDPEFLMWQILGV